VNIIKKSDINLKIHIWLRQLIKKTIKQKDNINNLIKMENCIFCKIVAGEIPAHKIWENDHVLAFLDVNPIAKGHTLVIPKKHCMDIFDADDEYLKEITAALKKVSSLIKQDLGATGVNLMNASGIDAQQTVFHLHFHIIPRFTNDGLDTWPKSDFKDTSLEETAKKIRGS